MRLPWRFPVLVMALVSSCLLVAACGDDEEEEKGATPTATPTAAIVATPEGTPSPEATPVATATATPVVTATPAAQAGRIIFLRDDNLWAMDPDGSDPALLAEDISHGSSSSGFHFAASVGFPEGVDEAPRVSPRGDKVAFIGSDGNLWVIDAGGGDPEPLSAEALPADDTFCDREVFIAGWAPGGERILYYVDSYDPMGGVCTPRPDGVLGFHVVDVESGSETHLPELPNFVAWLDTQRVIFDETTSPPAGWSTEWYTFDVSTEETEKLTKVPFEYFDVQAFLSYADNTMVYSCGDPDEGTKMVHANIDNTGQRVLLEGEWADLQHPRVSPNGTAFIFERRRDIGDGVYEEELYRYDLASGEETFVMSGFLAPGEWLDENRIVVYEYAGRSLGSPVAIHLVDTITGEKTTLAENVDFPW